MANINQKQLTDNLNKIKTEGGARTRRIGQIVQTAFAETTTELKAGMTNIRPLAKEVTVTAVDDLKQKSKAVATQLNDAWIDQGESPKILDHLRSLLSTMAKRLKGTLFPKIKERAEAIDSSLSERYGDRYDVVKQNLESAKNWYTQAQTQESEAASTPVDPIKAQTKDPAVTVDVVATSVELTSN